MSTALPLLTDSEEEEFRQMWRNQLKTKYGTEAVGPEIRQTAVDQLIRQVEEGAVIHRGRWYQITPGKFDLTSKAAIKAGTTARRRSPAMVIGAAIAVWLIASGLLWLLLFGAHNKVAATALTTETTTPASETATAIPATESAPAPGDPVELTIAGRTFPVRSGAVIGGSWQVQHDSSLATWLAGSVTNWAFFLDAAGDNGLRTWANAVPANAPVSLSLSGAPTRTFQVTSRQQIRPDQVAVLGPHQAGVTIGIRLSSSANDPLLLLQGRETATKGGEAGK